MTAVSVDKLYQHYEVLQEAIKEQKIGEYAKEYEDIIETASKGGDKEKLLAVQFVSKFFQYFPSLQFQAIEALFDTCEDDNMSLRKTAMKILPVLCKTAKEHTLKVADILSQLLQLEDPQEHSIATNSLCEVIKLDPMLALKGFFKQVAAGEDIVQEKCVKFLAQKFPTFGPSVITKDVEDYIFTEIKKIVDVCSASEFLLLMEYLAASRFVASSTGQADYIRLCEEYAELDNPFEPLDVDKVLTCVDFALPFFSTHLDSSKFIEYYCIQILPQFEEVKKINERGEKLCLRVLQQLAQMTSHSGQLKTPVNYVKIIFDVLKSYMPLPPENAEVNSLPLQEFSFVECLLYAFHQLARQCPEFLSEHPQVLKDFRVRLQYFSRGVQGCIKALYDGKRSDDCKLKQTSHKTTTNINTLIKDLFYQPPNYKSVIKLSFTTPTKAEVRPQGHKVDESRKQGSAITPTKRHAPITIDFDKTSTSIKQRKSSENMKIYTPPSGKFSNNFQNSYRNKPSRGGRGSRGYGRGRGGSRGSWRK